MRSRLVGGSWILGLAIALSACNALPTLAPADERPRLGVANGTTLDVTLWVNGVPVARFPAGGPTPEIDMSLMRPLPWLVEARSPTGRLLTSMRVEPGQVWSTTRPDGGREASGAMGRVDLSCGRLTIWAGDFQPSGPAPRQPAGQPGDCVP
jgi:hypothetical protein